MTIAPTDARMAFVMKHRASATAAIHIVIRMANAYRVRMVNQRPTRVQMAKSVSRETAKTLQHRAATALRMMAKHATMAQTMVNMANAAQIARA